MTRKADLRLFKALLPQKKLTEKYVGYARFNWKWSKVAYTADCTYGVPFTMFDKAIVGLLVLDGELSLEQIGEILGMNVVNDPDSFRLRDEAEVELLKQALDSLHEYGMVETGDIDYSACHLTPTGREYAAKGMKFRTERGKQFTLVFDQTSGQHMAVGQYLQEIHAQQESSLEPDPIHSDLELMKSVAAVQAPKVYSPEKGNSFQNPRINEMTSKACSHQIWIALLYDLKTGQFRLQAYETEHMKALDWANEWLTTNFIEDLIRGFSQKAVVEYNFQNAFEKHVQLLLLQAEKFEQALGKKPEKAMEISNQMQGGMEFIDEEFFWLNPNQFPLGEGEESFVLLSELNEQNSSGLMKWARSYTEARIFVLFERCEPELLAELRESAIAGRLLIYFAQFDGIVSPQVYFLRNEKTTVMELVEVTVSPQKLPFQTFHVREYPNSSLQYKLREFKTTIADSNIEEIYHRVIAKVGEELGKTEVSKKSVLGCSSIAWQAEGLLPFCEGEGLEWKRKTEEAIQGLLSSRKEALRKKVEDQLEKALAQATSDPGPALKELERLQRGVVPIENEMFDDFTEEKALANRLRLTIQSKINALKEEKMAKTYIIDTNAFIDSPNILNQVPEKDRIALSITVLEELDKLKSRVQTKEAAQKAIRNIRKELKGGKGRRSRIRKVKADLSLLPDELQNRSADNFILSLSLVLKDKNPILLTNDQNLQNKALALELKVKAPQDLK